MSRKLVLAMTLTLVLVGMLSVALKVQKVEAGEIIYIRENGNVEGTDKIQRDGNVYTFTDNISDEIVVERNNIVVDGADYTLQGTGAEGSNGIELARRSNVTVKNMEIKAFWYGILLYDSSIIIISGNKITNNGWIGIALSDSFNIIISGNKITNSLIGLFSMESLNNFSNNNTISGNNVTANYLFGINLGGSSNNCISGNNVTANNDSGIVLSGSSNNVLRNNVMADNRFNFAVFGSALSDFMNDVDTSNTVDGKPIVYLINQQNLSIDPQTYPNIGYLAVINSTNITIRCLHMKNNYQSVLLAYTNESLVQNVTTTNNHAGISLVSSSNNSITGSTIANNEYGIHLCNSSSNTINGNKITNNNRGIWLQESSNNKFHHNTFLDNTEQVHDYSLDNEATPPSINIWDDGFEGNYWSDYEGRYPYAKELDDSGIWDTPYRIDENNQDNYPLINPVGEEREEEEEAPSWAQLWWLWAIIAVLIVELAGSVYFLKKRKPPTPTAPTEGTLQNINLLTVATAIYKRRQLKTPTINNHLPFL